MGVAKSLFLWDGARKALHRTIEAELPSIGSMHAVGKLLAVGSEDWPAIHVYKLCDGMPCLVSRLIGHTAGATCFGTTNDLNLISGSVPFACGT